MPYTLDTAHRLSQSTVYSIYILYNSYTVRPAARLPSCSLFILSFHSLIFLFFHSNVLTIVFFFFCFSFYTAGGKGVLILTSDHMIIILIVFFALVIGMCASIIVSCWGKIQERRQRELEYKIRRSREVSVEQGLDRTLTVTSLDRNMGTEFSALPTILGQRNPKLSENSIMRGNSREDEEHGCYVPDLDLADYRKPNGGQLLDEKYSPVTPPSHRDHLHQQHSLNSDQAISSDCPLYLHHQQQRQDSLRSGSESPIPPPPPPPALSHLRGRVQRPGLSLDSQKMDSSPSPTDNHGLHHPDCAQHGGQQSKSSGPGMGEYRAQSLGPHQAHQRVNVLEDQDEELDDEKLVPLSARAQSMRFRAEAVIEMGSGPLLGAVSRPRSFAELRSAPDVVVLR